MPQTPGEVKAQQPTTDKNFVPSVQPMLAQAIQELRKPGPRPSIRSSRDMPRIRLRIIKGTVSYVSPVIQHVEPVKIALEGEEILHDNSLATLTTNFIVVRRPERHRETIIGLSRLSSIRRIETTHPGLLVIASAGYLLAAAAYCSKQGSEAAIPLATLATLFVLGYFMTRRASVSFVVDREATETMQGSLSEAAELVKAMEKAQKDLLF